MAQGDSVGRAVPWAAVVAVLVAATGAVFYFSSLDDSRRPLPSNVAMQVLGYQDAEARLWQDPFRSAMRRKEELGRGMSLPPGGPGGTVDAPQFALSTSPETEGVHELPSLRQQIKEEMAAAEKDQKKVLIVPVMVPAGPYGELAERRLRARVAVLEALTAMGYEPRSGDHIGYVDLPWCWKRYHASSDADRILAEARNAQCLHKLTVPYEWLDQAPVQIAGRHPFSHHSRESYRTVLVLWCAEEAFSDMPLSRLAALVADMRPWSSLGQTNVEASIRGITVESTAPTPPGIDADWGHKPPEEKLDFHVLGPTVSTTLRALLEEVKEPNRATRQTLRRVRMYVSTATADDRILLFGLDEGEEDTPNMLGGFVKSHMKEEGDQGTGFRLFRITPTDRAMATSMVRELERRGLRLRARLGDNPDQVAVVAELDTFYGRALPFSFAGAVTGEDATGLMREPRRFPQWVHPFVYLRGLDGKVPGEETALGNDKGAGKSAETSNWGGALKLQRPLEPPEGLNQSDYLRRLADQLADLDVSLRRQSGEGLKAVGVLGTDVYDKLLVLRALRDRLPGVMFFTTGLDARYMAPQDWGATHNLIIAAPFGLRLHEYYQRAIPPFRDSEQTAVFHTMQVAASPDLPDERPRYAPEHPLLNLGAVRLFEVGRSGVYDLSVEEQSAAATQVGDRNSSRDYEGELAGPPASVQPYRDDLPQWPPRASPWAVAIMSFSLLLAIPSWAHRRPLTWPRLRDWIARAWRSPEGFRAELKESARSLAQNTLFFAVVAIVATVLIVSWLMHLEGQQGEPDAWFDRVNVWPTEALRLFSGLLCIHLILKSLAARLRSDRDVQAAFALKGLPGPCGSPAQQPGTQDSLPANSLRPTMRLDRWNVTGNSSGEHVPLTRTGGLRGVMVYARNLWWEYQRRGGAKQRLARSIIMAGLFWIFSFALYSLLGSSARPTRGVLTHRLDEFFLWFSVLTFLILVFFVLDSALLNRRFINCLTTTETHYPNGAFEQFQGFGIDFRDLTEYADIRLIARRTRVVGAVVYYPFVVFFLIVGARSSVFADWKWPLALLIVLSSCLSMAIAGALTLRWAAERARENAISGLRERFVRYNAAGNIGAGTAIQALIDIVRAEKEGAFSLLSQHPIVAAVLLPSGGIGLWALLEYIAHASGG